MAVLDFYTGKTIFITGAAGFLGAYLLEVLLRCFPGITRIYILIRPKKGLDPIERTKEIFKKKIFFETCRKNPKLLEKVHVMNGDVSRPNLGMSEQDIRKICEEVAIVFHGAACISFTLPYRQISQQNAGGTYYVLELCKRIKNLEILVYMSTAYANSHIQPEKIEEKIYPLPYSAQTFLDEMENGTAESFAALVSLLQSKWNMKWPNSYTFSKCLAENILLEKANDLPVAIVRPSIVFAAYKGICPGYLEAGSLMADMIEASGKGFLRVFHADKDIKYDVVPIDLIVNAQIVAAWLVATGRRPSMFVAHCTMGNALDLRYQNIHNAFVDLIKRHPLPNSFQEFSVTLVESRFMYSLVAFYEHYIPSAILDIYLRLKGSKFSLLKLCRMLDRKMEQVHPFLSTTFDFQTNNLQSLSCELQPEEKKIFYTDVGEASFKEIIQNIPNGADCYNWSKDKQSPRQRQRTVLARTMMINFIKRLALFLLFLVSYFTISKVFF